MAEQDIQELLRSHGKERILLVLDEAGYSTRGGRFRCPFDGCHDQAFERRPKNCALFSGQNGVPRVKCFRCQKSGTLIDVLMAVRGWNVKECIDFLKGMDAPAPKPRLHVVGSGKPEDQFKDPEKLKPEEVRRIWETLDKEDNFGDAVHYLERRGLDKAVEGSLVRFLSVKNTDVKIQKLARRGMRLGMLTSDITGNERGIQVRLTREANVREPKINSVPGSTMARTFFGQPGLIESSDLICVTEGMADTLAVQIWAGTAGMNAVVVGSPGMGNLGYLSEELVRCGINIEGKLFLLFPQNDRPKNASRGKFKLLAEKLHSLGASSIFCSVPEEFEDVADYRRTHPEVEWPPEQFRVHLETDEEVGERPLITTSDIGISLPSQFQSKVVTKNLSTLLALLDDPYSREAIVRRPGQFAFCQMRGALLFEEIELREVHFNVFRQGIEEFTQSTGGKSLSFTSEDVRKAVEILCMRNPIHPVRQWLRTLTWDGVPRLDSALLDQFTPRPTGISALVMRKWFIGTVARAMNPGCKMDTVLVLTGLQGRFKSTFFDKLGGAWFTDESITPGDKDSKLILRRHWIIEWSELAAAQRAHDLETLKAFITQRVDRFRPPYGRDIVEAPRHCVIVGTTNKDEFLGDDTGARRWWPVKVRKINIEWVAEHRIQLFAEAVALYDKGEKWWLEDQEAQVLEETNRDYESTDAWDDLIRDWLEANPAYTTGVIYLTAALVLNKCIGKHEGQWTKYDQQRVGYTLKRLGYERKQIREGASRRWIYEKPSPPEELLSGT